MSDGAKLTEWAAQWNAVRRAAYAELVASYTPEQRALVERINEASRQERLCNERRKWPEGRTGKHAGLVAWPREPPQPRK